MNVETKDLDLNVVGKDGLTKAYKIQKHKPTAPMCFIRTVTGHMLFCQEDHPVWIKLNDGQDTVVEAKDVVMFHDKIWVDNTNIKFDDRNHTDIISDLSDSENFNYTLNLIIDIIENKELKKDSSFISGDNIYNFCLNLDKLVITRYEFDDIIRFLASYSKFQHKNIYSFNLVSQIKTLADKLNYTCVFDLYEDNGDIYWLLRNSCIDTKNIINKKTQQISEYIDIEQVISGIENYQGYVYDLKTESEEFMNNNVQTHNSFHTGGAVVFKKVDILKELSDAITADEQKYLSEMIYQKDNDLYSSTEVTTIKINKNIFKEEYAIEKVGNTYKLPLGYFKMYIGNIEVNATIEMPVEINIHDDYNETNETITLMYGKDFKLFTIKFFKIAPEKIAQSLDALVAGKSPWETPENLYKKFYEALSTFGPWDSCHLEIILATILRNKKDAMIPARLKEPYDPELHSIKTLPSLISWPLGVAYENLGKSLSYGLISKDSKKYSQIEKVLFGEPLSELSIDKLKEKKRS